MDFVKNVARGFGAARMAVFCPRGTPIDHPRWKARRRLKAVNAVSAAKRALLVRLTYGNPHMRTEGRAPEGIELPALSLGVAADAEAEAHPALC